jgi:hypothetical protein
LTYEFTDLILLTVLALASGHFAVALMPCPDYEKPFYC